jgi:transketolase
MLAVHAALFLRGWLTQEDLNTYCCDGSLLGVHPEYGLLGVDFASGSLGQGLFVAALRWRQACSALRAAPSPC